VSEPAWIHELVLDSRRKGLRSNKILHDGKVSHRCVHERIKWTIVVIKLPNDDVPSPSILFAKIRVLDIPNAFVDRERHSVTRDGGIVYDVRMAEFPIHAV